MQHDNPSLPLAGPRVLVTGASGFIGGHLVRFLLEIGCRVTCLVRRSSRTAHLENWGVRLVYGDACQRDSLPAAVENVDVVYHLAGLTKSLRPEQLMQVNRDGVENLARACAQLSNPPVLIVVSSLAAAGPSSARPRIEEDLALPVSSYGRSKREGELAAQRWAGELPISIVRPPVVLGEGDRDGLAMFRPVVRWGIHYVPGRDPFQLSLIHVHDLVRSLVLVAERGARLKPHARNGDRAVGYYFVECGETPSYENLGRLIGQVVGRPSIRVLKVPKSIVFLAAGAAELGSRAAGRALIFNLDKAREATAGNWTCSGQTIRKHLGFAPERPLAERLGQTAGWYRQHGWI